MANSKVRALLLIGPLVTTAMLFPVLLVHSTNSHDMEQYAPSDFSTEQVLYFDFQNENSTRVVDKAPPRTDGLLVGNPTYDTQGRDPIIRLSGDDRIVASPEPQNFSEVTVSFMINLDGYDYSDEYIYLIGKRENWWFFYNNNSIGWRVDDTNGDSHQTYVTNITANKWYHVTGTVSVVDRRQRLYLNGELADEKRLNENVEQSDTDFVIGGEVHGAFDDVRIFSSSLSEKEVRAVSNGKTKIDPVMNFATRAIKSGLLVAFGFALAFSILKTRR